MICCRNGKSDEFGRERGGKESEDPRRDAGVSRNEGAAAVVVRVAGKRPYARGISGRTSHRHAGMAVAALEEAKELLLAR